MTYSKLYFDMLMEVLHIGCMMYEKHLRVYDLEE